MKLQNIIFPENEICTDESLYYHSESNTVKIEGGLAFVSGGSAVFDTYFNSFSIYKWKKYTKVKNLKLSLNLSGKFCVMLIKKTINSGKVISETLSITENCEGEKIFDFGKIPDDGMFCFRLICKDESGILNGGYYFSEDDTEEKKVKLAIAICTYKREEYVKNNLAKLKRSFLENSSSELFDKLEIFISDNAGTLPENHKTDKIHIFRNKNTGGSGGFTRGIIEIKKSKKDFTHIILMDDDAVINPESVFRTYKILCLLKEEYKDAFIGGGMLRIDKPSVQVESGARWNFGKIISQKHNLKLDNCKNCILNEKEENPDYIGWWFCTFPIETAADDNLPLPLFIKCDDIEYSLRCMKKVLLINGICIWHEDFETKYSSSSLYYIQRNTLINNAVHGIEYSRHRFFKEMKYLAVHELMFYRYKNALLMIRACYDFLKGVEWLKNCDSEKLNSEIISQGYKFKNLSKISIPFSMAEYEKTCAIPDDCGTKKLIRKIKMNGIFMPAKRENNGIAFVPTFTAESKHFYRIKTAVHYDKFINKAFVTKKDYKKIISIYLKILKLGIYSFFTYKKAYEDYHTRGKEMMTLEFWEKYLDLKDKK